MCEDEIVDKSNLLVAGTDTYHITSKDPSGCISFKNKTERDACYRTLVDALRAYHDTFRSNGVFKYVVAEAKQSAQPKVSLRELCVLLSQKDAKNFRDDTLLLLTDSVNVGNDVRQERIPNLTCAAAVYAMIARARGDKQAMIDDFYEDPRKYGGNGPGAKRPTWVSADVELSVERIIGELDAGRPVILHGFGGPLQEHFVLVVGRDAQTSPPSLVIYDPYPGKTADTPGQKLSISTGDATLRHPSYSDISFLKMRLVSDAKEGFPENTNVGSAAPAKAQQEEFKVRNPLEEWFNKMQQGGSTQPASSKP